MVFTRYSGNPVLDLGAGGAWDDVLIYRISVLYRNNKWYLYYTGRDGAIERIGLATSSDGVSFTKNSANPLLDVGAGGTWDDAQIYLGAAIYRNAKWYMYYSGLDGTNRRIGLATSKDAINWTKYSGNPVLDLGAGGAWDDSHTFAGAVLYRNNKWYLYYTGYHAPSYKIGMATSSDGVTFTKCSGNPVLDLGAAGTWDDVHVFVRTVLYRNNKWRMYYTAYDGARWKIGLATSIDGINWTKHGGNPILTQGGGGAWDDQHVNYPSVLYRNGKWYMYYPGHDGTTYRIGLATSVEGV